MAHKWSLTRGELPSWRLLVVFVLVTATSVGAGLGYLVHQRASVRQRWRTELAIVAELKLAQIAAWREDLLRDGEILSREPGLARLAAMVASTPPDRQAAAELRHFLTATRVAWDLASVYLLDGQGSPLLVVGGPDQALGAHALERSAEPRSSRRVLLSDLHRATAGSPPHLDLVIALRDPTALDTSRTTLVLQVDAERHLFPLLEAWPNAAETAETLLVRAEGHQVLFLAPLRHRPEKPLTLRLTAFATSDLPAAMAARGVVGPVEGSDYRGVPVLAEVRAVPGSTWRLVAKVDRAEVDDSLRAQAWRVGLVVTVFIGLVALALLLARRHELSERERQRLQAEGEKQTLEARFNALTRFANDAILLVDGDLRLVDANQRAEQLYGYARDELLALSAVELRAPQARADLERRLASVAGGGAAVYETLHCSKDGTVIPVEVSLRVLEVDGQALYQGIVREIRDRLLVQAELRASEERFRGFVEHAVVGVYRTTPYGRILFANQALVHLLGYGSFEELEAVNLENTERTRSFDRRRFQASIEQHDQVIGMESQWPTAGGGMIWVRESARTVRGADGAVEYYEGIVEDLTRAKSLEAQLLHAQRMEAVGRLAGGVAHDFNNLLQAMLAGLDAMRSGKPDPAVLDELEGHARRSAGLARQLLLFARRGTSRPEAVDVNRVLTDSVDLVRRLVRENVTVEVETDPSPLPVEADRGQLEQALMNLAVNAADAMPAGGRLVLRSGLDHNTDEVWFEVADTGCGMTDEVKAHLFEPFFTTKGLGSGLGLAVVHGVASQHRGRVVVDSAVGRGSRFRVHLPRSASGGYPAVKVASPSSPGHGHGERILVVEDEDGVRGALATVLKKLGYEVVAVGSGEEALSQPAGQPFDVLLTDMVLPGISGAEVAAAFTERWPGHAVLVMSGYSEDESVRQAALEGRVNFLQKPFDMAVLAAELHRVLAANRESSAQG